MRVEVRRDRKKLILCPENAQV